LQKQQTKADPLRDDNKKDKDKAKKKNEGIDK
jgi:hypothetical protein